MERAKPVLKVAAVLSAVCLVAAFVAYRAGAFDRTPPAPEPQPATETPDVPTATPASPDSLIYMAGSKSTYVYDEKLLKGLTSSTIELQPSQPAPATGTQPASPAKPTFLGGSKSLTPLFNPPPGPGSAEKSSPPAPPAPVAPQKKGE